MKNITKLNRNFPIVGIIAVLLILLGQPRPSSAQATSVMLDFNSLPSTQSGWSYYDDPIPHLSTPESQYFSIADDNGQNVLHMDTRGRDGDGTYGYIYPITVDKTQPFTLTFVAKVTDHSVWSPGGFHTYLNFDDETFDVQLATNPPTIAAGNGAKIFSTTIDTSVYHTYRLVGIHGGQFELFVDGNSLGTGDPWTQSGNPQLFLGDGTRGGDAVGDWKSFSFAQSPATQISGMSPTEGSVGTTVTINGAGFGSPASDKFVSFNGIPAAQYISWSDTQIVAVVAQNATTGQVNVNLGSGATVAGSTFTVTTPTITGLSVDNGPLGTLFTVNGSSLGDGSYNPGEGTWSWVTVNDIPIAAFHDAWSPTSINNVELAANATTGPVKVLIHGRTMGFDANGIPTVTGETTLTVTGPTFTVTTPTITDLSADNGPVGTAFTVNGADFGQFAGQAQNRWTWVTVNDVPVASYSTGWSPTAIGVQLAANATTGPVKVLIHGSNMGFDANGVPTILGEATLTVTGPTFTVTTPTITGLSVDNGPIGTAFTVNGADFGQFAGQDQHRWTWVTVNDVPVASYSTGWSPTAIGVQLAANATTGPVKVLIHGSNTGFDANGVPTVLDETTLTVTGPTFTVTTPTISGVSPQTAPVGTLITIDGANFGQSSQAVLFNTTSASISAWGSGQIQATIPNGLPVGSTSITVSLQGTQTGFDANGVPRTLGTATVVSSANTDLVVGNPPPHTTLNFNSLPSTQPGWSYYDDPIAHLSTPESQYFSIGGGALHMDTRGRSGDGTYGYVYPLSDSTDPFTLTFTAQVTGHSAWSPAAFTFYVREANELFDVSLAENPNTITAAGQTFSTSIDTTMPHEYRIEGVPGGQFQLFVGNESLGFGTPASGEGGNSQLFFGDGTRGGDAAGVISAFSFTQGITTVSSGSVSGHIKDSNGNPLANISVYSEAGGGACTNANGDYTIANIPLNVAAQVSAGGNDPCPNAPPPYVQMYWQNVQPRGDATLITLTQATPDVSGIDFTLVPGGSVSGHVTDSSGNPISNMVVYVDYANFFQSRCTDSNGNYNIGGINFDTPVVIEAASNNFCGGPTTYATQYWQHTDDFNAATRLTLTAANSNFTGIDFALVPAGSVSGHITDSNGNPVANMGVSVDMDNNGQSACTDSNGNYTIAGFPVNQPFRVRAGGNNFCSGGLQSFITQYWQHTADYNAATILTASAGNPTLTGIDFALVPGGFISGHIVDTNGNPVAHIGVSGSNLPNVFTCTDASGNYTLSNVAFDTPIRVFAAGYLSCSGATGTYVQEYWQQTTDPNAATLITITAGSPNRTGIDFTLTQGGTISGHIVDGNGHPLANITVSGGAPGLATCTDSNGNYTFMGAPLNTPLRILAGGNNYCNGAPGVYVLMFWPNTHNYDNATLITLTAANADQTGIDFTLVPGGSVSGRITDSNGNPLVDMDVSVDIGSNGQGGCTDSSGNYTIAGVPFDQEFRVRAGGDNFCLGATATYITRYWQNTDDYNAATISTITAASPTLTGIDFSLSNSGPASKLAFVQQPTNSVVGAAISPTVSVAVQDANGNLVTTDTSSVTVAIGANPGSGTLGGTLTVAAVNGVATFSNLTLDQVGTGYTLTASDGSLTSTTSATFNVTPPPATKLAYVQQPTNAAAGVAISPAITVAVEDANGNVATTDASNITLAIGANPGHSTLSGTVTVAAVNGIATFPDLSLNKKGNNYTLTASDGSLTSATSATFDITPGAAAKLVFSRQPATITAGGTFTNAVKVAVQDAFGNAITTDNGRAISIILGLNPGGATLGGTLSQPTINGIATFSDLTLDKAAAGYTLITSADSLTGATSNAFTVQPSTATHIAFSQQPTAVASGVVFNPKVAVALKDSFENIVTTDNATTITLALGANPGGATLSGNSAVVNKGVATFNTLKLNQMGSGYTLIASSAGMSNITSDPFDVSTGAAALLAFVQQPSNTQIGSTITPAVTVQVEDAAGNPVTTSAASITIKLGNNPTAATLSGTTTVNAVNGIATFSDLSLNKIGTGYTLTVTSTGLTAATSNGFNVAVGASAKLVFGQQPSNATAGSAIAPAITVLVEDVGGNIVTTDASPVTLSIGTNPGGGALSGTVTVPAVNGVATFSNISIDKLANGYKLQATDGGLAAASSSAFNIAAGVPTQIAWSQQPGDAVAGVSITPAIRVSLLDSLGNIVTGSPVSITVALGTNPGSGTLSGTLTKNTTGGVATFSNLKINKPGNGYTLTASASGLPTITSNPFIVSVSTPTKLVFGQQPSNATAGNVIAPAITVMVEDANGNIVVTDNSSVTLAISTNPGGGTLSGTATVATVNGVATFSDLSIDKSANGYKLQATDGGLTAATSSTFNIASGAPTQMVFSQQPSDGSAGTVIAPAIRVSLLDSLGNVVTGSPVSITVALGNNPGGGTLSGTLTRTTASGVATFNNLKIDKPGNSYTLTVSASGLPTITSNPFNISVGAAVKLVFGQQPSSATAGSAIAPSITVQVLDASGNLVTTDNSLVTLAISTNPGSGTLGGTATVAAVNGVATFGDLSINKSANGYKLQATDGALTAATSTAFNIASGPAAQLSFSQQPSDVKAGSTIAPAVKVTVLDSQGNVVTTATSVTIAIGNNPGGSTLGGTLTANTSAGVATFSNLTLDKPENGYTLSASAGGGLSAQSSGFNVTP